MGLLHVFDDVILVSAPEVVPVLMISTAEETIIVLTAAEVNGRQVVVDGAKVAKVDVLLDHTFATARQLIQLTIDD